jgi:hypothetical protein
VPEEGIVAAAFFKVTTRVLRPPFNDLAPRIVTPAFRCKCVNRRGGARQREKAKPRGKVAKSTFTWYLAYVNAASSACWSAVKPTGLELLRY